MRASVVQVTVAFILSGCGILPLRSEPAGRPLLQLRSPKRRKRRRPAWDRDTCQPDCAAEANRGSARGLGDSDPGANSNSGYRVIGWHSGSTAPIWLSR